MIGGVNYERIDEKGLHITMDQIARRRNFLPWTRWFSVQARYGRATLSQGSPRPELRII